MGLPRELEPCREVTCLMKVIAVNENIFCRSLSTDVTTLK